MCIIEESEFRHTTNFKTVPLTEAVGMVLMHDITEIRPGEFKGRAFKKGHIVKEEDIPRLQNLGKENLFVLNIADDEIHENEAAYAIANALMGDGVTMEGEPKEGKINIIAEKDGLLKVNKDALLEFNMLGEVMCATLHNNAFVKKGQLLAGTRAIPLVVNRNIVERAVLIAETAGNVIAVKSLKSPKVGVVITGNEIYYGRIKDGFASIITDKILAFNGEIVDIHYTPDDETFIIARLEELIQKGADLLITTGGMSVDPDDVTRFAIRKLGARDIVYGSAVLPGAMFLIGYTNNDIPILGIPACGLYHKVTIFDLILPGILAGEKIGRKELAEFGHGGLCLNCKECRYPVCPFGK